MPLAEREAAAGKAAAPVPVVERPAKRWGDGPGAGADLDDLTIRGVPHHHPARVARLGCTPLLIERLACSGQSLHEQTPDLRRQPAPENDHTVLVLIHMQRPARVPPGGLASLGLPIHTTPAANDPLHWSLRDV